MIIHIFDDSLNISAQEAPENRKWKMFGCWTGGDLGHLSKASSTFDDTPYILQSPTTINNGTKVLLASSCRAVIHAAYCSLIYHASSNMYAQAQHVPS